MAITINIYYTGRNARKFAEEMTTSGVVEEIRAEKGNLRYEYFLPMDQEDTVLLIDSWVDQAALDVHHDSPMMKKIIALREKYDVSMRVERYITDEGGIPQKDQAFIKKELFLQLEDKEWPFEYTDHDRQIVRAIVYDEKGYFYFVRAVRDDLFGQATLIETSGGGVEENEELKSAIVRELKEELGVEVDVLCKIGVVSDYYNLIHRHNINNYYLCKAISFGEKNLTQDEIEDFHLSTLKMTYEEAIAEYEKRSDTKLGRVIANRELPILRQAKMMLEEIIK